MDGWWISPLGWADGGFLHKDGRMEDFSIRMDGWRISPLGWADGGFLFELVPLGWTDGGFPEAASGMAVP